MIGTRLVWLAAVAIAAGAAEIPHLEKHGSATRLIVEGKPFVMLSGELHNSSATSLEYMRPIWPRLKQLNLNSVIATVSWELLEPEEGRFDFALVDGLVTEARRQDLKLVLIWFASWKNGVSSYPPLWVKRDLQRFPRVRNKLGHNQDILSPFSTAARDADARAYRALMRHLREIDSRQQTVVMMQVENEAGVRPGTRDYSPAAEQAFAGPVPRELIDYLTSHRDRLLPETKEVWSANGFRTSGTWSEIFGTNEWADEVFMAWHYARYIDYVAAAGKQEYALPAYVNAWLQGPDQKPGVYPSGGPVARAMDYWKAGAKHLDLLAPDIYLPDFRGITQAFARIGNPLFIPEAARGNDAAGKVFYALAQHDAIGFAPFAIDEVEPTHPLAESYRLLAGLLPRIIAHQGDHSMAGILEYQEDTQTIRLGGYNLNINFKAQGKKEKGFGLAIATGPDEFLVVGAGFTINFGSTQKDLPVARLGPVDELAFRDSNWITLRRLNGDETMGGYAIKMPLAEPGVVSVKVYRHEL